MKRYILYFLNILLVSVFTSCEVEEFKVTFGEKKSHTLTLRLNTGGMQSRTIAGEDTRNENLIKTLDCFFYTSVSGDAVCYKSATVPAAGFTGTEEHAVNISFDDDELKDLFGDDYRDNGNNKKCFVYIIANRPSSIEITGSENIQALKSKTLKGSFATLANQANFVMDSGSPTEGGAYVYDEITLTINDNTATLSGHVNLYRSAAKVGLYVRVPDQITNGIGEDETVWTPVSGSMTVKFHKGVNKANIDNTLYPYTITDEDYFDTRACAFIETSSAITENDVTFNQTTEYPFYTYPTSTAEGQGTYFTLYLSWKSQTAGADTPNNTGDDQFQYKNCTYQIPVNKLEALERNNYYRLLLNVGVLGTESDVVTLEPSYTILDWNDETIDTDIEENVYLVVQEHDVTIYNKNTYSVEFASSHKVEAQILSITQPNYSQDIAGTSVFCNYNNGEGKNKIERGTEGVVIIDNEEQDNIDVSLYRDCSVNVSGNTIVLNHIVVNKGNETIPKEYDIAPYTITVYVKMVYGTNSSGGDLFYDDIITFTQYPSMYAEAKLNDRYTRDNGHVYVYNNHYDIGNSNWNTVRGAKEGGNHNPNMYVIYISVLSPSDPYVISDPRDLSNSIAGNSTGWDLNDNDGSGNNKLTNYYQTRTDNSELIAPIFRMASSHGKCGNAISYNNAKRRCASYQEDGYPAGRWRVPTTAELRYIAKLSSEGKIPHLYSDEGNYWTATGRCTYYTNGTVNESTSFNDNTTAFVRCVYDEWYWGSEQLDDKTIFTWGDE